MRFSVRDAIEVSATAIEALAVAVIVIAIAYGTVRFLLHMRSRPEGAYERYKVHLGKALLLGLEFLVAADIIRTVALEATMANVLMLGMLVIVRTFLSWALVVEVEGRWPWNLPVPDAKGAPRRTDDIAIRATAAG
jgi:uncharacterized membrane protein